jgi:hypothetical protein
MHTESIRRTPKFPSNCPATGRSTPAPDDCDVRCAMAIAELLNAADRLISGSGIGTPTINGAAESSSGNANHRGRIAERTSRDKSRVSLPARMVVSRIRITSEYVTL